MPRRLTVKALLLPLILEPRPAAGLLLPSSGRRDRAARWRERTMTLPFPYKPV
jgi:hypothetical protein